MNNQRPEQDANTNLDQDLKQSRSAKYANVQLQADVKAWLGLIFGESNVKYDDLMVYLKDGTKLCEIINTVWGMGTIKYKTSTMAFVQMENIDKFLTFCKSNGIQQDELFQTVDLYEQRDPYQVIMAIQAVSRTINKNYPKYPLIGPNISQKRVRPPIPSKPKKLMLGQGGVPWSSMEYGYTKGANQGTEGVVFGGIKKIDRN